MTEPVVTLPADPAEIERTGELLGRLGPAIDAFLRADGEGGYPPYVAGTIPSEAADLPADGIGADATVDELLRVVAHGNRMNAPGWLGFITTGATTVPALAGAAVASVGAQRYTLHAFNALERTGLRWLADLCGLPDGVAGVFSSGGSTAQLIALGTARQAAFERLGHDASATGLPPGVRSRIYASAAAHRTVHRSAAVLGLGRDSVLEVPVDREGRIRLDELEAALDRDARAGIVPVAVVAIAGVTDTGAVDRIDAVTAIARRFGAWVHVDGAYGLVANAAPRLQPLFAGVEEADSWIVDPHKWLATGARRRRDLRARRGADDPRVRRGRGGLPRGQLRARAGRGRVAVRRHRRPLGGPGRGALGAAARRAGLGGAARDRAAGRGRPGGAPRGVRPRGRRRGRGPSPAGAADGAAAVDRVHPLRARRGGDRRGHRRAQPAGSSSGCGPRRRSSRPAPGSTAGSPSARASSTRGRPSARSRGWSRRWSGSGTGSPAREPARSPGARRRRSGCCSGRSHPPGPTPCTT